LVGHKSAAAACPIAGAEDTHVSIFIVSATCASTPAPTFRRPLSFGCGAIFGYGAILGYGAIVASDPVSSAGYFFVW
tara:strand:+ start:3866 stop:4096 length:231 start_codon:yes stop_codon:yes gene_type:complete